MTPTKLTVYTIAFAVMGIGSTTMAFARKPVASFCSEDDRGCIYTYVANVSSATVISIKITQKARHGCEKVEKRITKNTAGSATPWFKSPSQTLSILMDKNCRYEVSFNTTKGCVGDKQGQFSRKNFKNQKDAIELRGACGTLSTKITSYD